NCTLATLELSGCQLADIQQCLCTNNTLMTELGVCVLDKCDYADQIVASDILRNELCAGVPQPSRSTEIIRDSIIIATFTFPIIILRLISRVWITRKVWWDDWAVIVAAVLMIPNSGIPIYSAYHGFGVHFYNVPVPTLVTLGQLYYTATIFYALIQNLAKFSILLLYVRIFPTPRFRLILKITMGWMVCHTMAFTFGVAFQCFPVQALWDLSIHGQCLNVNALTIAGAIFSIVEDFVIMLLPISELKGLNLSSRKRAVLCFMFAVGSFACVTSMIRLKVVWHYTNTLDGTWNNTDVMIWSEIETYTAIICSCLMCIRPLLMKCFPVLFPSSHPTPNSRERSRSITNPDLAQKAGRARARSRLSSKIRGSTQGDTEMLDDEEREWIVMNEERRKGDWSERREGREERGESWLELADSNSR
ncbi:hypothetical protein N431DRAFT_335608, partial [Stipitochalara longipes BDJ]